MSVMFLTAHLFQYRFIDSEHGYFYVCLYSTCRGFQANIVEEYVLLSALQHIFVSLKRTRDQKSSSGLMSNGCGSVSSTHLSLVQRLVKQLALWERLVVMPLWLLCSTASQPPSHRRRGSLQVKVSMKKSLVQPVHSVETHSLNISEAIDFVVTLHFSVGTHRDSNEPPLHVVFFSGFIQGVCGTSLAVDGFGVVRMVGSGTLFVKMLASKLAYIHATCNLLPPPTFFCTRTMQYVPLTGTPTYAQREWLGQPCRTPDHGLHPSSEAMGSVGPQAAPNLQARWERRRARLRTHIWVRSEPPPLSTRRHCAARTTSNFASVDCRPRAGRAYAPLCSDRARLVVMSPIQWYTGTTAGCIL